MRPYLLVLWGWLGCVALSGCQGRAYRDLYAENMAAEIRDLEDQLYEYDHQYKLLEQELQILRQQNQVLKAATPPKRSLLAPLGSDDSRSQAQPHQLPIKPEPMLEAPPRELDSILEAAPKVGPLTQPAGPDRTTPGGQPPGSSSSDELPTPRRPAAQPPTNPAQASPADPAGQPAPSTPKFPRPQNGTSPSSDFDSEELLPPTIDPGVATPPPLPPMSQRADGSPLPPEDNLEMNLARIEIPTQRASALVSAGPAAGQPELLLAAASHPSDARVIELAFHPAFSRAINMDERPNPDGLYLVLQPKNEQGQLVPVTADLLVFALDPAREGEQAKIGRWEFTAAEVQQKLQPIGSEQGIHLRLPWTGGEPTADRVIVFALYKFTNGRQVMGEKEIYLSSDGTMKTVWSPRAASAASSLAAGSPATASPSAGSPAVGPPSQVAQASFQAATPSRAQPSAGALPTATIHSNPVVRPTAGSGTRQPPPPPYNR